MMNLNAQPHWLARGIASVTLTPIILVLMSGLTLWLLGQSGPAANKNLTPVVILTLLAIAAGCAALTWIRPQRAGLSPPNVMLSLGFGGMLLGLLYDLANAGPARLDTLCAQSSTLDFADALSLHLSFLPGMHAGMLIGGLLAIPVLRRVKPKCSRYLCSLFVQNLICTGWMLAGMTMGALWLSRWPFPAAGSTLPGMLGGMFAGMTWGMVFSVALYRGFLNWRSRV